MKVFLLLIIFYAMFSCHGKCPMNTILPPPIQASGSCITKPDYQPTAQKYRTIDGTRNNKKNPLWGASNRP